MIRTLFALLALAAFAQNGGPRLTDTTSVEARRNMEKVSGRDPAKLAEPEIMEWVKARLAWIALDRLEGREEEALRLFADCGTYCAAYGPEQEWAALKSWGCARKKKAEACRTKGKRQK